MRNGNLYSTQYIYFVASWRCRRATVYKSILAQILHPSEIRSHSLWTVIAFLSVEWFSSKILLSSFLCAALCATRKWRKKLSAGRRRQETLAVALTVKFYSFLRSDFLLKHPHALKCVFKVRKRNEPYLKRWIVVACMFTLSVTEKNTIALESGRYSRVIRLRKVKYSKIINFLRI